MEKPANRDWKQGESRGFLSQLARQKVARPEDHLLMAEGQKAKR
jgi:hypothetical protein